MAQRAARIRARALDERYPYSEKTHLIHGRFQSARWEYKHHVVPPQSSSVTFRLDTSQRGAQGFADFGRAHADGHQPIYVYDRLDEPTRGMLEDNLAYAEGGEVAVTYASGMGAISAAVACLVRSGQRLVCHRLLYGCTYSLFHKWLPRFGIEVTALDFDDLDGLGQALTSDVRVVYFETPVNPDLHLLDVQAICRVVAEENGKRTPEERVIVVVDNTFATPYCQRPLELGADVVVASLTKNIGGFGTDLGGVVVGPAWLEGELLSFRKDFGGVLSPKSAWPVLVYGLPTLPVRVRQQQQTALRVAEFLEADPRVERVCYPGLPSFPQHDLARRQMVDYEGQFAPGTLLYFVLTDRPGQGHAAEQFIDYLAENAYSITMAVSLGQVKTLIEHPYSMTHSSLTATESDRHLVEAGGIRLSVGLEKGQDLIHDLWDGLDHVFGEVPPRPSSALDELTDTFEVRASVPQAPA
ncbi:MAG: PLP-dependent transferase [Armatimonadetes bacterium]|nr:PLP-dependent transferase [Armatimonadota bacterium]